MAPPLSTTADGKHDSIERKAASATERSGFRVANLASVVLVVLVLRTRTGGIGGIGGGHWRWTLAVDIGNTYLTLSYALAICNGSEGIRNWGENRPKEALHGVVGAFANTLPSGTWVDANHAMQCS